MMTNGIFSSHGAPALLCSHRWLMRLKLEPESDAAHEGNKKYSQSVATQVYERHIKASADVPVSLLRAPAIG